MVSNIFYFHPYLGKWSNLTNIFQGGWNHQLDIGIVSLIPTVCRLLYYLGGGQISSINITFWIFVFLRSEAVLCDCGVDSGDNSKVSIPMVPLWSPMVSSAWSGHTTLLSTHLIVRYDIFINHLKVAPWEPFKHIEQSKSLRSHPPKRSRLLGVEEEDVGSCWFRRRMLYGAWYSWGHLDIVVSVWYFSYFWICFFCIS